jgi:hypothetical protein
MRKDPFVSQMESDIGLGVRLFFLSDEFHESKRFGLLRNIDAVTNAPGRFLIKVGHALLTEE